MAIISGGQTLSTTNLTDLLDGGASTLHSHAASAAFPTTNVSYVFHEGLENICIFHVYGSGHSRMEATGLLMRPGTTAGSHARCFLEATFNTGNLFKRKPTFRCTWYLLYDLGDDFTIFVGHGKALSIYQGNWLGVQDHLGFKTVRVDDGAINLYATQANGTTELASSVLATPARSQDVDVAFKVISDNGTNITSVDYYFSINRVAWSSATNLASNGPRVGEGSNLLFGITNDGEPHTTELLVHAAELGG